MKTVRGSVWCVLVSCACLGACADVAVRNTALGLGAVTLAGAKLPTTSISQVYYLGVFDPQDQLPPTIYRIRVNGQASALSLTKFASGWVRADLVDSLSGRVAMPSDAPASATAPDASGEVPLDKGLRAGRRLMMFGPEGFREAPRDHRLVVVMGSDPSAFFSAVDQALGAVASVTQGTNAGPSIEKALWTDLARVRLQGQRIEVLSDAIKTDFAGM